MSQEYKIRDNMDHIEKNIQTLMKEIKEFNYIEFYHEHYNL